MWWWIQAYAFQAVVPCLLLLHGCGTEAPTAVSLPPPERLYITVLDHLDPEWPGRGRDIFDTIAQHRAMAYGLILSAECNRIRRSSEQGHTSYMEACTRWLLANSDMDQDGIHGFGLADPWDAFQDQSVNTAHHEYTITSSIAIMGLLDMLELGPDTDMRSDILRVVRLCIGPYMDPMHDSPAGIPAYSLATEDARYDVFNPAVMIAGQMMRFSTLLPPGAERDSLRQRATGIMKVVQSHHLRDPQGFIYWNYGAQEPLQRPNDLVHAAYMVEGMRAYLRHGGDLDLEWSEITGHLYSFRKDDEWFEYPQIARRFKGARPRLWALGMLMYALAQEGDHASIDDTLLPQLAQYHDGEGHFRFKVDDDRRLVRHDAHLLLGLSHHLFRMNDQAGR